VDTLSQDVVREHLGYHSLQASPSLSTNQESQESMILSDWMDNEDIEATQLQKSNSLSPNSEDEKIISLEEASQKIACKEKYHAPPEHEFMDMGIHLQATIKQKRTHNGESPRQPLRQINNTIQGQEKSSPGPSKVSSSTREKRTRKYKIYN